MMRCGLCLILLGALAALPASAEGEDKSVTGGIEIGHRNVDLTGNEDKYREDFNLDSGFFVPEIRLSWRPEGRGWLDELALDAQDVGNEPFSSAGLQMRKVGLYDLKAGFRSSKYFYRDAGYFFREGGDLHTWDTKRTLYNLDFKYRAAGWLTLRLGGDRSARDGSSTTTRDVQREDFLLHRPVDQTARGWRVGADLRFGWADLSLDQRWASYKNRWLATASRTDGLQPGGSFLDTYRQIQVQDASAPASRISVGGRPLEWLRFSAGYARVDAEVDYKVEGRWAGLDYDESPIGPPSQPYVTTMSNRGRVERDSDLWDGNLTFALTGDLDLTAGFSRRSYDEKGTIDSVQEQVGGKEAGVIVTGGITRDKLTLDTTEAAADWRPTGTLTLSAGVGLQTRKASYQLADADVETKQKVYRAGARWRPTPVWDLALKAEKGNSDDPYTPASPTDIRRYKADLRVRPLRKFSVAVRFKDESKKNDLTYRLEIPTDDSPPGTRLTGATFKVRAFGAALDWSPIERLDLSAGFDRAKLDADADIDYVIGEIFGPGGPVAVTTLRENRYASTQKTLHGEARARLGGGWSCGLLATLLDNDGTFPLSWDRYGAEVRYDHRSGWHARLAFDRYDLDENNPYAGDPASPTPHVNNYTANLWTLAAGYSF